MIEVLLEGAVNGVLHRSKPLLSVMVHIAQLLEDKPRVLGTCFQLLHSNGKQMELGQGMSVHLERHVAMYMRSSPYHDVK